MQTFLDFLFFANILVLHWQQHKHLTDWDSFLLIGLELQSYTATDKGRRLQQCWTHHKNTSLPIEDQSTGWYSSILQCWGSDLQYFRSMFVRG